MELGSEVLWYGVPLALAVGGYALTRRRTEKRSLALKAAAVEAGLDEPPTLHPVIDPLKCIGCGACTRACPEGDVLGLIKGKAELVTPSECIGHGACRAACPVGAITLVFGTARRGIDLPQVGPDFQTNVPGLYVAGELGGMGLIRNAVEQGRQAVDEIARRPRARGAEYDLIIVGAGPAGFSASLAARQKGLNVITLEQDVLGGAVAHYPRGKLVMSSPAKLPGFGAITRGDISKEDLLRYWNDLAAKARLPVAYEERVDAIERDGALFRVSSRGGVRTASSVLLCVGRRGSPRRLGAPGEDLSKVVYRMVDPRQYAGRRVLVVGGGDSALEAAAALAEETDAAVTLSYRGSAFQRSKPRNRDRVDALAGRHRIDLRLGSEVAAIEPDRVVLTRGETREAIANDVVIICAGGVLPTALLTAAGIRMETKFGEA